MVDGILGWVSPSVGHPISEMSVVVMERIKASGFALDRFARTVTTIFLRAWGVSQRV